LYDTSFAFAWHFLHRGPVRRASGPRRARQHLGRRDDEKERLCGVPCKKGGVGAWGQVPMPPNAQIPDADIKDLVSWILTLKK